MTDDTTLRLEQLIDAPREKVFAAWTSEEAMLWWYQDGEDWIVRIPEHNVSVGGSYRVEFGPEGDEPYIESGTYIEIDPPRRLVMTGNLTGPAMAGWSDTTVTVELEEEDGKTRLVLTHSGFPSSKQRDMAGGGWPGFLDRLAELLES